MAKPTTQEDERVFEEEVLRVSRALFARDRPYQGSTYLDDKERDGVFVSDEAIAVVEATVSRRVAKAQKDGDKLRQACNELAKQHPFKAIKGYFVTMNEPTADQRAAINSLRSNVVALSFAQLRGLLVDTREYLSLRAMYAFGSARNARNGSTTELDSYIPIGFTRLADERRGTASVSELTEAVASGNLVVLTGDFGAGKSMTLREVHRRLAAEHLKGRTSRFPVTLNLRDHQGQRDTDEALRRHCVKVGFESPSRLVRAWRAGEIDLILDGFDEIATTGWLGQANNLRQIRRRSVELVRNFVKESPAESGLLIAGRRHLFDSLPEMKGALGLTHRPSTMLATDQFTDDQISEFLEQQGWTEGLPQWLPPRPLLLGYLAASGAIGHVADPGGTAVDAASGWDLLLDKIAGREALIELGVDGDQVRRLLERLATMVRSTSEGLGPIFQEDFSTAFQQVCGYQPDEGSYALLQRMPGLGVTNPGDGSRFFIDETLVDAARAGDLVRYLRSPEQDPYLETLAASMAPTGAIGMGVASLQAQREKLAGTQAVSSAKRLQLHGASDAVAYDAVRVAIALDVQRLPSMTFDGLGIDEFIIPDSDTDLGSLHLANCVINNLDLTEYGGDRPLPRFSQTLFGSIVGVGSVSALPAGNFEGCEFGSFDPSSRTTRGILAIVGLSPRQRVALTVLKKVYLQGGSARRASALVRGLDDKSKMLVPEVCDHLASKQFVLRGRVGSYDLYYPVRGVGARVRNMLEQGVSSKDPILADLR